MDLMTGSKVVWIQKGWEFQHSIVDPWASKFHFSYASILHWKTRERTFMPQWHSTHVWEWKLYSTSKLKTLRRSCMVCGTDYLCIASQNFDILQFGSWRNFVLQNKPDIPSAYDVERHTTIKLISMPLVLFCSIRFKMRSGLHHHCKNLPGTAQTRSTLTLPKSCRPQDCNQSEWGQNAWPFRVPLAVCPQRLIWRLWSPCNMCS